MTDTLRTRTDILSLFYNNSSGDISAQDMRDFVASVFLSTDNQLVIGSLNTSDLGADQNGIKVNAATPKTILFDYTNHSWTSSESFNLGLYKSYKIDGDLVLDQYSLGDTVSFSRLTHVGTILSGTWQGTPVNVSWGGTGRSLLNPGSFLIGNGADPVSITDDVVWNKTERSLTVKGYVSIENNSDPYSKNQNSIILEKKNNDSKSIIYSGSVTTTDNSEKTFFEFDIPDNLFVKFKISCNGIGFDRNSMVSSSIEATYRKSINPETPLSSIQYIYLVGEENKSLNTDNDDWDVNFRLEDGKVRLKVLGENVNWVAEAETWLMYIPTVTATTTTTLSPGSTTTTTTTTTTLDPGSTTTTTTLDPGSTTTTTTLDPSSTTTTTTTTLDPGSTTTTTTTTVFLDTSITTVLGANGDNPSVFFAQYTGITVSTVRESIFSFNSLSNTGISYSMNINVGGSLIATVTFSPNQLSLPFRITDSGATYSGSFTNGTVNF